MLQGTKNIKKYYIKLTMEYIADASFFNFENGIKKEKKLNFQKNVKLLLFKVNSLLFKKIYISN